MKEIEVSKFLVQLWIKERNANKSKTEKLRINLSNDLQLFLKKWNRMKVTRLAAVYLSILLPVLIAMIFIERLKPLNLLVVTGLIATSTLSVSTVFTLYKFVSGKYWKSESCCLVRSFLTHQEELLKRWKINPDLEKVVNADSTTKVIDIRDIVWKDMLSIATRMVEVEGGPESEGAKKIRDGEFVPAAAAYTAFGLFSGTEWVQLFRTAEYIVNAKVVKEVKQETFVF